MITMQDYDPFEMKERARKMKFEFMTRHWSSVEQVLIDILPCYRSMDMQFKIEGETYVFKDNVNNLVKL